MQELPSSPSLSCQVGQICPETLKIAVSSGKPKLDAGALKTITASAPFDPPPREMTVSIVVEFREMGKT